MAQDKSVKDYKITDIDQLLEPGTSAIPERAKIHTDLNLKSMNIPMLLMLFFMIVLVLSIFTKIRKIPQQSPPIPQISLERFEIPGCLNPGSSADVFI